MAFEKTIQLKNCRYDYTLSPSVKKFTLKDNTFFETKVGNYELTRLLEKVPNSGEGFQLKIIINKELTDNVIKKLNEREKPIIFILWGNNAKAKEKFIDTNKHYILKGAHPSPLSANRGFFGCKHFSEVNRILKELKEKEIDWQIENKE